MATQIDLGAVVPIGKGDWNSSTTYERTNIVRHNSTAWICKVATSKGVEPSESSSDWYLLVKDMSAVTSINGMRGDVTVDSILTNPSADDSSLKIASTSWVKTKVDNVINEVNTELSQVSSTASTALQTANSANTKANNALSKAEEAFNKAGLPLGHIYLWPFSTPPDGSIQLNGSTYNRELYSDLWNLIQSKGWYKPETEWQQIANANGGYCPWYSDGDGSTTFRTPKFAPYQKIALASGDVGKYHEAGLPNLDGSIRAIQGVNMVDKTNVFSKSYIGPGYTYYSDKSSKNQIDISFDASACNPIYGNSTTVQPEAHDWIICAVAFGTATNVGSVDVANVMSAVSQVQAEVSTKLEDSTVHIIETWKSSDGKSWYNKYSNGFIEQGGANIKITFSNYTGIITLNTPFNTTNYSITAIARFTSPSEIWTYQPLLKSSELSKTSVTIFIDKQPTAINWIACGY